MLRRVFVIFIPIAILASIYVYLYEEEPLNKDQVVVYTYSSFASNWGPGLELKRLFKEKTGYDVDFVDAGEAGIIIQRILLEKENGKADIALGLDQFQLEDPSLKELFIEPKKLNLDLDKSGPIEKIEVSPFVAYNWAPMTFIYRNSDNNKLPKKLDDFLSPSFKDKIILLDPRTSSPGYIFFHWIVQRFGEDGARSFLEKIKKNVYTVTPSWSSGYGLFKKKQSQYVFSYLTSPIYHWIEEKDTDYQPLYLDEQLPYHIEYAGILKSSKNIEVSNKFIEFLFSEDAQKVIMNKNYMLPVIAGIQKSSEFEKLKKVNLFQAEKIVSRDEVLKVWKSVSW